ncbi:hypothetical protein HanIR_Chr02g0051141 [Helianthus annuus]|nr:hypothetical protein HanIR_Chr02g0051141 [Helianthus annuus]
MGDKLVSGDAEDFRMNVKENEEKSDEPEVCGFSKFVSTIATVSTVEISSRKTESSVSVSSENIVKSVLESSGSSSLIAGDSSVNSSPLLQKNLDENSLKSLKNVSLYDVLEYEKRNIHVPASPDVSELLTPVKGSIKVKSEFEVWMMRRDSSLAAEKEKEVLSGNPERVAPIIMSESENMKNGGICDDDVRSEHSMAAVEDVMSKNPNQSKPSDGESYQGSQMNTDCGVGPSGEPETTTGPQSCDPDPNLNGQSPKVDSPGMVKSGSINEKPINADPNQSAVLPSATSDDSEKTRPQNNIFTGSADEAKAQKR